MKKLLILLFATSVFAEENRYNAINKRNAFDLTSETLPPVSEILQVEAPKVELFLTGVTRWRGVTKAHLYSKDLPSKYLSLKAGEQSGSIKVLAISKDGVRIVNSGTEQVLTFASNRLKTTIISAKGKPTVVKESSKESGRSRSSKDKESKKPTVTVPRPSVVKVPSRQPKIDPRIIERGLEYLNKMQDSDKKDYLIKRIESLQSGQYQIKSDIDQNERGLEYLNKMEDGDRKDYLLKRIESLQSGQYQIKSDIDQNERRRQYDEWRKRREK